RSTAEDQDFEVFWFRHDIPLLCFYSQESLMGGTDLNAEFSHQIRFGPRLHPRPVRCRRYNSRFILLSRDPSTLGCLIEHNNQLAVGLVRFHHPVGFTNVLELEHPGRLSFEPALRHVVRDLLKWDIGQGKARRAKDEAPEEGQIHAARHLQQWVEVLDRVEAAQPPRQARPTTSTEHRKGIKDGAVANEIEHRVNLLALRDVGPEVATFDFHAFGTEVPEHRERVLVWGRGDDMGAGIDRHIERGLSKRGGGAANDYRLSRLEFEVSEQARPGGGI